VRPLIGLSAWYEPYPGRKGLNLAKLNSSYVDSVYAAGGAAVVLSPSHREDPRRTAAGLLARVDGLILTGGADFDPALYGQDKHEKTRVMLPLRSEFELALFSEAERIGMPVFGICLGIQAVNVARGGTLHQHVADVTDGSVKHTNDWSPDPPMHPVRVAAGSRLRRMVGLDTFPVNSRHHQAVDRVGRGLKVTATAPDGVVEALEDEDLRRWLLAVQWHPEDVSDRAEHLALFQALVEAGSQRRASTALPSGGDTRR